MEDVKVLRGLDRPTSPDKRYSCPRRFPSHQREEPSLWFHRRPDQKTLTNRQVWRVQQKWTTWQQWRVRQMLWTAQQVTVQQGGPSWSRMTSQKSWMTQQKLPTQHTIRSQQGTAQHMMMTTRQVWPAQHTVRIRQWMAQQWLMNQLPMVLRQGTRQRQDRIHPCYRMSAVCFSLHCPERPTRLLWLTWCQCGLSCSVGWTRVWLFHMPRPGPLHRQLLLRPEMMTLHPGGPRLHLGRQTDDPGRQWDGSGHLWEGPTWWMTLETPHVPVRPSEGRHRRNHLPGMLLLWIFRLPWTYRRWGWQRLSEEGLGSPVPVVSTDCHVFQRFLQGQSRQVMQGVTFGSRRQWSHGSGILARPAVSHGYHARIAQGLKEDEEVEKTTLSETLNTSSSTFKHLTVKQIFPREPYRLKIHRDAQYVPKPPGENSFSDTKAPTSYQMSHGMCLDTEELARRSAIYAWLADSMVASVIEELCPKDERTKLLREKLAIIQEAQVSAVSAGFAAASNLQLLHCDALLKNFGFQPQGLSTVRTAPFEGSHVLGPEPKELQNRVRAIRQADRMAGSSVTFAQKHRESMSGTKATSSRKTDSRTSVFDRLGSPAATTTQRTVTQEQPCRAGAGRGARHRPYPEARKKSGKSSAASSTRQRWRVPGGGSPGRLCPCPALAESTGQLPGHRHCRGRGEHCIPATTSAHPSVHQLRDQKQPTRPPASRGCLAVEGGHRAGHQHDIPRVLQPVVPGPKEDRRSAACDRSLHSQPPHGSSTLQDGDARVRPFSHQKSG